MTNTITFKAWLTSPEFAQPGDETRPDKLTYTNLDMTNCGWLEVGVAEIKLTSTFDRNQLVASMVNTLQEQIRKERAESYARVAVFEQRINDLLLLTNEVQS